MANETPVNACNALGQRCPGLEIVLKGGGARRVGLRLEQMLDMRTGNFGSELVYHFPKKVDGYSYVLVTFCPFCGGRLIPEKPAPSPSPTGPESDHG